MAAECVALNYLTVKSSIPGSRECSFFKKKKKKVFIWLHRVLAVVRGIFIGSCGTFCRSVWTLCSVPGLRICGSWT